MPSVAKAEQALSRVPARRGAARPSAPMQIGEQRQAAQSTLSARRSRLEALAGQLARARREIALADSDVDKRVRVLDSRRRTSRRAETRLTEARAEARGLEEVDRAFESASPALAWALAQERALPGLVGPVAEAIRAPQHYEALVERLLGADLFGLLVEPTPNRASGIASQIVATHRGRDLARAADRLAHRVCWERPRSATRLLDDLELRRRGSGGASKRSSATSSWSTASTRRSSTRRPMTTGARFATVDGAVVWPTGKLTLGTQVGDTEGVLARKRRINELHDDMGALDRIGRRGGVRPRGGRGGARGRTAGRARALAEDRGAHRRARLAARGGRPSRAAAALRSTPRPTGVDERIADIRERTAKDRPSCRGAHGADRRASRRSSSVSKRPRSSHASSATCASERRARSPSGLSTCQVEIATVSEREVHLKRQVNTITSELAELEDTVRAARESEIALRAAPAAHPAGPRPLRRAAGARGALGRTSSRTAPVSSRRTPSRCARPSTTAQDAVREVQAEIDEKSDVGDRPARREGPARGAGQPGRASHRRGARHADGDRARGRASSTTASAAEDRAHRLRKQIIEPRSGQPDRHGGVRVAAQPPRVHGVPDRGPRQQPPSAPEGGRRDRPQDARPLPGDVRAGRSLVPGDLRAAVPRRNCPTAAHRPRRSRTSRASRSSHSRGARSSRR